MVETLAKVPDVEIDPEGTFKYILVRVKDGDAQKDIVRGTKTAEYHSKFSARGAISATCSVHIMHVNTDMLLAPLSSGVTKGGPDRDLWFDNRGFS